MKRTYSLNGFGVTKHEITLKNGLKVIFIEKPFAPIYAKLMMRAGSVFNNLDTGLAHFTEHVIVSGSKRYPKKEDFAGIISSVGGYSNANTSQTCLALECEVALKSHLKNMRTYFSEALTHVHITEQSLKKEKGVIISEINKARSNPGYLAGSYLSSVLGNGTNWGSPILGKPEFVSSITKEDVENFFSTYCCVENMTLVISGGCTLEDVIKTFSSISFLHGSRFSLPEDPMSLSPNQRIFFQQDLEQTNLGVYFQAPEMGTRESLLLGFAMGYAHDGLSSRFYKKIRNERGLAYGLNCSRKEYNQLLYIGTNVGTPDKKVDETIDSVFECYSEYLKEGITQKQVDDKIKTLWFKEIRDNERSYDWIEQFDELYPEKYSLIGDFPDWFNYMKKVDADEISQILRKYIKLDSFHLFVNGKESIKNYF